MDGFDSNLKNGQLDHQSELPEDFGWDDMREGIYEKMQAAKSKKNNRPWWWLLLLLLMVGGLGGWFALEYSDPEKAATNPTTPIQENEKQININSENIRAEINRPEQSDIENSIEATLPQSNLIHKQIAETKKKSAKLSGTNTTQIAAKFPEKTITNISKESPKIIQNELNTPSKHTAPNQHQKDEIINRPNINTTIVQSKIPVKVNTIPAVDVGLIKRNPIVINSFKTPQHTTTPAFKKHLSMGLAGGIMNWTAFDATNINDDHVSGFPGYTINPSIGLSLTPNHSIQMDYEYSFVEELFDYEGTRPIQVLREDEPVRRIVSSLTGNVMHTERKDTLVSGILYYRELKYNQYRFHTFSLGYRFDQVTAKRSSFGFYAGASYLLQLRSKGKRLNEQLDVITFDYNNPLFEKNQLALRLGVHYNYQLNPNTQLFSQIMTTKYITNWEIDDSNSATRPFLYGLQIGLRHLIK